MIRRLLIIIAIFLLILTVIIPAATGEKAPLMCIGSHCLQVPAELQTALTILACVLLLGVLVISFYYRCS